MKNSQMPVALVAISCHLVAEIEGKFVAVTNPLVLPDHSRKRMALDKKLDIQSEYSSLAALSEKSDTSDFVFLPQYGTIEPLNLFFLMVRVSKRVDVHF